jgi:formylglycine-generating enzyme required for sulfatase activity
MWWLGLLGCGVDEPTDTETAVVETAVDVDSPEETAPPPLDTAEAFTPRPDAPSARSAALGVAFRVEATTFRMGCDEARDDAGSGCFIGEQPTREITLTRDVWVMEAEVTQRQWEALGFANPSTFVGPWRPVDGVSWWDAVAAANRASEVDGLAPCFDLVGCTEVEVGRGRVCESVVVRTPSGAPQECEGWRLPTEAEWEAAARAGTSTVFPGGDDPEPLAWFDANSEGRSWPVCLRQRNAAGLCDLAGNVSEWTSDWLSEFREDDVTVDPYTSELEGPSSDKSRAFRGGFWGARPDFMRIAYRSGDQAHRQRAYLGFRLVRTADLDPAP